jgi:hypothetical protein
MHMHVFQIGDLIQDKKTKEFGLILHVDFKGKKPTQLIVAWQDCEPPWDTDPADVKFICHIPAAEIIPQKREEYATFHKNAMRKNTERLIRSLEKLQSK